MEISDSDESINRSRRKASRLRILSSSSDEDFVNVNSEVNECSTEEEDLVSKSENEDSDEEWQEVKERTSYGVKLYKLCLPEGYTYNIEIYAGKNETIIEKSHSHDVVMRLLYGLLFEGRILFIDNYYTSVPLGEELLEKNTFMYGTVKINKKFLSSQAKKNQKRGEMMSFENRSGVKFLKWTDKRPVCMLTTSKNHRCKFVQGTNGKVKPDAVFDYNIAKKGVDLSDQLSGYYSCLRKTIKWYRKVIIQLICGTSLVNAWYIHKRWGTKNMNMLQFREVIIDHLLAKEQIYCHIPSNKHVLQSHEESARESRKRCKECYKNLSKKKGRDYALTKLQELRRIVGIERVSQHFA
ncbi:hypothetical protein ACFW04_011926 [Cataglyphis niger]